MDGKRRWHRPKLPQDEHWLRKVGHLSRPMRLVVFVLRSKATILFQLSYHSCLPASLPTALAFYQILGGRTHPIFAPDSFVPNAATTMPGVVIIATSDTADPPAGGGRGSDGGAGFCEHVMCPGSCILGQRACLVRSNVPGGAMFDGDGGRGLGLGTPVVLWPAGGLSVWGAFNDMVWSLKRREQGIDGSQVPHLEANLDLAADLRTELKVEVDFRTACMAQSDLLPDTPAWIQRAAGTMQRNPSLGVAACFPRYPTHNYVDFPGYQKVRPWGRFLVRVWEELSPEPMSSPFTKTLKLKFKYLRLYDLLPQPPTQPSPTIHLSTSPPEGLVQIHRVQPQRGGLLPAASSTATTITTVEGWPS